MGIGMDVRYLWGKISLMYTTMEYGYFITPFQQPSYYGDTRSACAAYYQCFHHQLPLPRLYAKGLKYLMSRTLATRFSLNTA